MLNSDDLFGDAAFDTLEFEPNSLHKMTGMLEQAHAVARGIDATVRLLRVAPVLHDAGDSLILQPEDEDAVLALVGHAAQMLAARIGNLSDWAADYRSSDVPEGVSTQHHSLRRMETSKEYEKGGLSE